MRRLLILSLLALAAVAALALKKRLARPGPLHVPARGLAFPRAGGGGLPLRAEPAFPGTTFRRPLFLCAAPGDDKNVYVVEQDGRILRVGPKGDAAPFLDITARVARSDMEEGLLGLAFDPDYGASRALYVYYSAKGPRRSVLSRFRAPEGRAADPASEEVLLEIEQPYGNHNGGMVAFGPDGFLYVGVGDGGLGGDPHGHGQDRSTLLGTILRIDPRGGPPYGIPADNPFADGDGDARPEIWAYGLRNPWRFSFGPDGRMWAGDVGQNRREEIDLIVKGGNYGWNVFEGRERYGWRNALASGREMIPPVHDYAHRPVASVTGGYVYRGRALPLYRGRYFFGDFVSGQVWTLAEEGGETAVQEVALVPSLSSFGEDAQGELYALSLSGAIYRFRERPGGEALAPARLSETGLFNDTAGLQPARGVLSYEVRHPAWHDGASARRWIALPDGGRIGLGAGGELTLPPGTALVMHLDRDGRRRETRVLFHDDDGWAAYSYRWNDRQTDAFRSGESVERHDWTYPGVTECFACHNEPAGRALGMRTSQLDRQVTYRGEARSQLALWNELGILDHDIRDAGRPAPLPARDGDSPVAERARAWLDVHCACCHREGGLTPSPMDLRYGIPLEAMGIVDAAPRQPPEGQQLADRIVAPGRPEGSQLWQRLHADGTDRMPPLSRRADPLGDELLREWIAGMPR